MSDVRECNLGIRDYQLMGQPAAPSTLQFHVDNKEVGRLFLKDGKLHFEGADVDASALILFKQVQKLFNGEHA